MAKIIDRVFLTATNPKTPPIFCVYGYKRYIDDLFIVLKKSNVKNWELVKTTASKTWDSILTGMNSLKTHANLFGHQYLERPLIKNIFHTNIHQKVLNKYLYISTSSCHNSSTSFLVFIKGELYSVVQDLSSDAFAYRENQKKDSTKDSATEVMVICFYFQSSITIIGFHREKEKPANEGKILPFILPYSKTKKT
jgi:hypothetical protein